VKGFFSVCIVSYRSSLVDKSTLNGELATRWALRAKRWTHSSPSSASTGLDLNDWFHFKLYSKSNAHGVSEMEIVQRPSAFFMTQRASTPLRSYLAVRLCFSPFLFPFPLLWKLIDYTPRFQWRLLWACNMVQ